MNLSHLNTGSLHDDLHAQLAHEPSKRILREILVDVGLLLDPGKNKPNPVGVVLVGDEETAAGFQPAYDLGKGRAEIKKMAVERPHTDNVEIGRLKVAGLDCAYS